MAGLLLLIASLTCLLARPLEAACMEKSLPGFLVFSKSSADLALREDSTFFSKGGSGASMAMSRYLEDEGCSGEKNLENRDR